MADKAKTETKKINKILVSFVAGIVVALIATVASYNYWHDTNIRMTFQSDSENDILYQVFYQTIENKQYTEKYSVRQTVKAGENDVEILLPTDSVKGIRLDFGTFPGTVKVKGIKIEGNTVVELKDFDKYQYYKIDSKKIDEDGLLTIVSNQNDPFMYTDRTLEIYPGDDYDWLRMGLIAGGSFIVAFLLAMLINRKKK